MLEPSTSLGGNMIYFASFESSLDSANFQSSCLSPFAVVLSCWVPLIWTPFGATTTLDEGADDKVLSFPESFVLGLQSQPLRTFLQVVYFVNILLPSWM